MGPFTNRTEQMRANIKVRVENGATGDHSRLLDTCSIPIPQFGAKKATVQGDEIVYSIHLDDPPNVGFFRFRPSNEPSIEPPVGFVGDSVICLYTANTGDATAIKMELARQYDRLSIWYVALREEAEEFNRSLPQFIDEVIGEHEERVRAAKKFEDELNS